MAIYVGSHLLTGTQEVFTGPNASQVYLGNTKVYPENTRYVFQNGTLRYSSGSQINAAGSNYAYYTADVLTYVGDVFITSAASVTMDVTRVSGDTNIYAAGGGKRVNAYDRTNVTGDSRSAYFRAYYDTYSQEVGYFTVTQGPNRETWHNITTSVQYTAMLPDTSSHVYQGTYVDSNGGNYCIMGQRYYKDWNSYTSGYNSGATIYTTGYTSVTAATYSNLGTWLHNNYSNPKLFSADTNTGTSNRSQTITARFSAGTDTSYTDVSYTVQQYRAPYDTYEYRIVDWNLTNDTWDYAQSGTSYYATFTADCEYRTAHWANGSTTYGSWTDYNDNKTLPPTVYSAGPTLICGQGHWGFYTYPSGTATGSIRLNYENQYSTYGRMRIYPVAGNTGASPITNTLTLLFGNTNVQTTLTHNGDGSFNISPTSLSFNYQAHTATITVTTALSNWSVSDNAGWITTSVNGNVVTVTVTENTSTTTDRTGNITFTQGGRTVATCPVTQTKAPAPAIVNVETLYEMGNGWIVGRYKTGVIPDQYNTKTYVLVIARSDRGSNCTFNFSADGYYNLHQGPSITKQYWSRSTVPYAGESVSTTDADGNPVQFYGFSIGGGPGAETNSYYSGISIA